MGEKNLASLSIEELLQKEGIRCSCGRIHRVPVSEVEVGSGILWKISQMAEKRHMETPVVIADKNTAQIGKEVCGILERTGIHPHLHVMESARPEPDEYWVGTLALRYARTWDGIIAVGSGTINDICKILANLTGLPYLLAATAPSMDGYVSDTSSMVRGGLKVSIPSACPDGVLLDSSILARAPMKMIQAGLGDMAAKYVSLCEWKISSLITGEYYCEEIAGLVRKSLEVCMESCGKLVQRDEEAAGKVAYGLLLSGIAMSFAGISRPASGTEHYFSHIWDMTALEHHTEHELHGIQVGVGTLLTIPVLEAIRKMEPDRQKALDYAGKFRMEEWEAFVVRTFGSAAGSIIRREREEKKYDRELHARRLDSIMDHWDEIGRIIDDELPDVNWLREKMAATGAPVIPGQIGISPEFVKRSFLATKDIRDKYISTRLLWDLGVLEETADRFF